MYEVLWLAMIFWQIAWAVIVFGWRKKCPKWLRIIIGVGQCFMMLAVFGLTMDK